MKSVPLTLTQKISYYLLPLLLVCFAAIALYYWMAGKTNHRLTTQKVIFLMLTFLLLAIIVYLRQKRSLNFYSISSHLHIQTKIGIIKEILHEHQWTVAKMNGNFIQAEGHGFRKKFDLRTWSELMTIEIDSSEIRINSICNPDGRMAQAFSFGKNKQNIRDFEMIYLQKTNKLQ